MIPTLIEIPLPFTVFGLSSIPIHSFGFCMVLAFIAAWRFLQLQIRAIGDEEELAEQMVTWAAIGGIVGARVMYLISFPEAFLQDPLSALFGGAGFVFYGGFIGGTLAVILLLQLRKKPLGVFADMVGPTMALGYAIGRVGCQLSGDGDYGMQTDSIVGLSYRLGVIPTPPGILSHPAPIYESLLSLLLCLALTSTFVKRWQTRSGQIFGLYLVGAALSRFLIEYVRIEPVIAFGLTQAQLTAIGIAAFGIALSLPKYSVIDD